jgi:hypothetical protein
MLVATWVAVAHHCMMFNLCDRERICRVVTAWGAATAKLPSGRSRGLPDRVADASVWMTKRWSAEVAMSPQIAACLPARLHPVSRDFLDAFLAGDISAQHFRRFFHLPNSDYLEVGRCILQVMGLAT